MTGIVLFVLAAIGTMVALTLQFTVIQQLTIDIVDLNNHINLMKSRLESLEDEKSSICSSVRIYYLNVTIY